MVLFVGMPALEHEDREAFQEIEVKRLFSSFVKWAAVIRQTERIPEFFLSHTDHHPAHADACADIFIDGVGGLLRHADWSASRG